MTPSDPVSERVLTLREGAGILLMMLLRRGATFTLTTNGDLRANLDRVTFPVGNCSPADLAKMILSLAPEIKAILRDDRIH